jgi:hypothetical protein
MSEDRAAKIREAQEASQDQTQRMAWAILASQASAPEVYKDPPSVVDTPVIMLSGAVATSCNVGDTLDVTEGNWIGEPIFTNSWTSNVTEVGTSTNYTTQASDAGNSIVCEVTATNNAGSTKAASNSVTVAAGATGAAARKK